MKKGSLYCCPTLGALVRCVDGTRSVKLKLDNNANIVNTDEHYFQGSPEWTLWSIPPLKRRTYMRGEPVFLLRNVIRTVCIDPRDLIFWGMTNNESCLVKITDGKYQSLIETHILAIRSTKWQECDANCRKAVIYWLLTSVELRLPKDMRRMIGQYIWETRDDQEWENQK